MLWQNKKIPNTVSLAKAEKPADSLNANSSRGVELKLKLFDLWIVRLYSELFVSEKKGKL